MVNCEVCGSPLESYTYMPALGATTSANPYVTELVSFNGCCSKECARFKYLSEALVYGRISTVEAKV